MQHLPEQHAPTTLLTPKGQRLARRIVYAVLIVIALFIVATILLLAGGSTTHIVHH